ncbi:type II toxin-antitoxin system prevent-host-death family antitoxin [Azospirillum sp. sgz302134]
MGILQLKDDNRELASAVERALREGPLTIVRDGTPTAVVLSADEYSRLADAKKPTIIDHLLKSMPDGGIDLDEYMEPRHGPSTREAPDFD